MNRKIFTFLSHQMTIISIFLSVSLIGVISLILFKDLPDNAYLTYNQLLILKILSFVAYTTIAYFTYKGIKIFRWLIAAIILLTGIHGSILGIFGIEWHQFIVKPYFIVLGLYFILGGITLLRLEKA